MNASSNWHRNRLLLALPPRDLKQLMPKLEHIPIQREQVLIDADSALDHVYFPDSGVVSVLAVYADGIVADWSGLKPKDLYEARDLRATIDSRELYGALISASLGIDPDIVRRNVNDSKSVKQLENTCFEALPFSAMIPIGK